MCDFCKKSEAINLKDDLTYIDMRISQGGCGTNPGRLLGWLFVSNG